MNIQELELLGILNRSNYTNQRDLSRISGYSLGKVNMSLKRLQKYGFLDEAFKLTRKADYMIQNNKPKQAVILAAGSGMRMIPINMEMPKGLLEVKGEALIERIIKQLKEANINQIKVIVGFMKEQYEYLIDRYNVELIFNENYGTKNNLYSLAKAIESINNAYIVPCDIWCRDNPFSCDEVFSWYMVSNQEDEESSVRINRKKELRLVRANEIGNRMIGIAYICDREIEIIKKNIKQMVKDKKYNHSFWEEAAFDRNKMILAPKQMSRNKVFEINTIEELRNIDEDSNQLKSELLKIIAHVLKCGKDEIIDIEALKKGMTNRSFIFRCRGKRYIMRVPGAGTEKMIDRRQEYNVYQIIRGMQICDPLCYISSQNGYKISEFLEGARACNPYEPRDVKKCMCFLKENVHKKSLTVEHKFDIFEQLERYEFFWNGESSIYRDYKDTKGKIYKLKSYIDKQEKDYTLTHIDAIPDNFLFFGDKIYLIDWEYAGMQDPHVDIAMFAIYSMYNQDKVEELIDLYFDNKCPDQVRTKIYCYIAICGLLWSNWCEYKRMCGVEFGEYSLRQYRYAKEYYGIAMERIIND